MPDVKLVQKANILIYVSVVVKSLNIIKRMFVFVVINLDVVCVLGFHK